MRVGMYSEHLYQDGQIGTGASKYIYYLIRELERLGVDVVRLRKGDNPSHVDVLHDPHAPWNAPLRPRRPLVITVHDLTPFTHPRYYPRWVRTLFAWKVRWFLRRSARVIVDSHRTADVLASRLSPRGPGEDAIPTVYNQASLVVHPCPEEGFGFVPLEALACGAHVLARAPAVRETLGPYGCYFDDPAVLGARILDCLTKGPMGTREERSQYAKRFTFRAMAEGTLRSYKAAASGSA